MKASDLKALFSFAPSLSLNSFFSSERAERRGEERSSTHSAPLERPLSSPLSLSLSLLWATQVHSGPPAFIVLAIIQDAEQHHNRHARHAKRTNNDALELKWLQERALSLESRSKRASCEAWQTSLADNDSERAEDARPKQSRVR